MLENIKTAKSCSHLFGQTFGNNPCFDTFVWSGHQSSSDGEECQVLKYFLETSVIHCVVGC